MNWKLKLLQIGSAIAAAVAGTDMVTGDVTPLTDTGNILVMILSTLGLGGALTAESKKKFGDWFAWGRQTADRLLNNSIPPAVEQRLSARCELMIGATPEELESLRPGWNSDFDKAAAVMAGGEVNTTNA